VTLVIRQFPLHPEIPDAGVSIAELFGPHNPRIEAMRARLRDLMNDAELPYLDRSFISNSRTSQELAKWAEVSGNGAIHDALFRAYFARGEDIGNTDVLVAVAESVGLDPAEARRVLAERTLSEEVDADWQLARRMGVTAVPTYLCDGRAIVGAQPYELLERLATLGGAKKR
jgi:predicted DsbA family dithiol-disulfide isomerase